MECTQPNIAPERDAAAELQTVLRAMRAEIWGSGLNAVLAWLFSRWIGRWIGQIAAQFEQVMELLRAGHVWTEQGRAIAPRAQAVSQPEPAASAVQHPGWLEAAVGSQTPDGQVSWRPSRQAARTAQSVCRVVAAESSISMTARAEFDSSMRELAPHSAAVRMPLPCGVRIRVPWVDFPENALALVGKLRSICFG